MSEVKIQIRLLGEGPEIAAFVRLLRDEWGDDPAQLISQSMLLSMIDDGGVVLGAFDGPDLIGGTVASLDAADGDDDPARAASKLVSERLIVDKRYRNQGIGYHLKLAQYAFCQQAGIRQMTWLFDPLHSVAAHLTIRKLGGVVSEDVVETDALHYFQAGWWLTSSRVKQRLTNGRAPLALAQYLDAGTPILNPSKLNKANLPEPSPDYIQPTGALGLIEIPARFSRLSAADSGLAQSWRDHVRALFGALLPDGFILTDFIHTSYQGRRRSFYVCSLESRLREFDQSFNRN